MTPEIANQIGIAYGLYLIRCKETGANPLDAETFSLRIKEAMSDMRETLNVDEP